MKTNRASPLFIPVVALVTIACGADTKDLRRQDEAQAEGLAIVGGSVATSAVKARTVAVKSTDGRYEYVCTASILDTKTVLTAAHCMSGLTATQVIFGSTISGGTVRTATGKVVHSGYVLNSSTGQNDVALVTFSGGLPSGYQAVELYDDASYAVATGSSIVQAGYGVTAYGNSATLGTLNQTSTSILLYSSQSTYYAYGSTSATCSGDSGGPDFYADGSMLVQLGVHSMSDCANVSISADVRDYKVWIQANGADVLTLPAPEKRASLEASAAALDASLDLRYTATHAGYHNYRAHQEKYLQDAAGTYYLLLPNGVLYQWKKSLNASVAIASLDVSYYANPKLLAEASERSTAITPATLASTYGFYLADGGLYTNHRNSGEKYFRGNVSSKAATGWYFILSTGAVYGFNGDVLSDATLIGIVDASYYADPIKLVTANYALPIDAVAQQASLYLTYTTTHAGYFNYRGQNEKYLQTTGGAYYFIVPNGTLFKWGKSFQASVPVAALDVAYYNNPKLLVEAVQRAGAQPTAASLTSSYAFKKATSEYFNYRGSQEKYFNGKTLNATNSGWYYILPDGSIYAWQGSIVDSTLVAVVPTSYYTNLSALYQ